MPELQLSGLAGNNPLGFLAALGAQATAEHVGESASLHWTDDPVPHAVLGADGDAEAIAASAIASAQRWLEGPALAATVDEKLKLSPAAITQYLCNARSSPARGVLAMSLVAEKSLDNSGKAKPSDFYFTAGQMKFVSMAREILGGVTSEELVADMTLPWSYASTRPSLMWDVVDDRVYSLSSANPSSDKKLTNPGAEALALLGLSRYPCFRSARGTATQGCSGSWKRGSYTWPLWGRPATIGAVRSLLAHASAPEPSNDESAREFRHLADQYQGWGITRVMQSQIRRSDQGGYGTFGPPRVIWQRD